MVAPIRSAVLLALSLSCAKLPWYEAELRWSRLPPASASSIRSKSASALPTLSHIELMAVPTLSTRPDVTASLVPIRRLDGLRDETNDITLPAPKKKHVKSQPPDRLNSRIAYR